MPGPWRYTCSPLILFVFVARWVLGCTVSMFGYTHEFNGTYSTVP